MDRSPALLTKSQREGLLHGLGSGSSDRKMKQRIRNRLRDSAIDLRLAFLRTDKADLQRAFQPSSEPLLELRDMLEEVEEEMVTINHRFSTLVPRLEEIQEEMEELRELYMNLDILTEQESHLVEDQEEEEYVNRHRQMSIDQLSESILNRFDDLTKEVTELEQHLNSAHPVFDRVIEEEEKYQLLLSNSYAELRRSVDSMRERNRDNREAAEKIIGLHETLTHSLSEDHRSTTISPDRLNEFLAEIEEVIGILQTQNSSIHRRRYKASEIVDRELQMSDFEEGFDESIIDAVAFFIRVADVVGADVNEILESAAERHYDTHREELVTDTVDMNIDVEMRERAVTTGRRKNPGKRYSNAELRALTEDDNGISIEPGQKRLTEKIIHRPSIIEDGLQIKDIQVRFEYDDIDLLVDLVGRTDDELVLIETLDDYTDEKVTTMSNRLEKLVHQNIDQQEREIRAILVLPAQDPNQTEAPLGVQDTFTEQVEIRRV